MDLLVTMSLEIFLSCPLLFCPGLQEINSNLQSYLHTGRDLNVIFPISE